jgi:hypothetical protein
MRRSDRAVDLSSRPASSSLLLRYPRLRLRRYRLSRLKCLLRNPRRKSRRRRQRPGRQRPSHPHRLRRTRSPTRTSLRLQSLHRQLRVRRRTKCRGTRARHALASSLRRALRHT